MIIDPITEEELVAYVDGQLDAARRFEVESHLAQNPGNAARVMADLRDRAALRTAFTSAAVSLPDRLRADARRLDRAFVWDGLAGRMRRAAASVLLVATGWLAHTEIGTFGVPGTFASPVDLGLAEEAQRARQTVRIRAQTMSQRATLSYDRADLEKATGLVLPEIPIEWTVRDVQVFPARHGTGVEVAIDAGTLGEFALFATQSLAATGRPFDVTHAADGSAYWRVGRTAYALSGTGSETDLAAAASRLAAAPRS